MLAFRLTNEMLNRGWLVNGVDPSDVENLIRMTFLEADALADTGSVQDYVVVRVENDFYVMDTKPTMHRRVAKFYPWPRAIDAKKLAEQLAHKLNALEAKIKFTFTLAANGETL